LIGPPGPSFESRPYVHGEVWFQSEGVFGNRYSELKMPRAARSIGAAISKNPLLIFIPDHRVVNSNGSIGGFAGKWNRKPGLLELEERLAG
jgi:methylated-DNA-[protein]-cysteine S-methyltransferase